MKNTNNLYKRCRACLLGKRYLGDPSDPATEEVVCDVCNGTGKISPRIQGTVEVQCSQLELGQRMLRLIGEGNVKRDRSQ